MAEKRRNWKSKGLDFINNLYAGATLMIGCAVFAIFYTRFADVWEKPIINGLVTLAVVASLYFSLRAVLSLPSAAAKITPENVGEKVLEWLHRASLKVQSIVDDDSHFFFICETDGKKIISVSRNKRYLPEYLTVKALMNVTDEQRKRLEDLTADERISARLSLQLEMARALVGYKTENLLFGDLYLFKRVPITETLHEDELLRAVWEIEAAMVALYMVGAEAVHQHDIKAKESGKNEARISRRAGSAKAV